MEARRAVPQMAESGRNTWGALRAVTFSLEEHSQRVWRFALRLTRDVHQAEDLSQEVLLRAWRHRWRLRDPRRGCVWLFRITMNLWRDQARRNSRRPSCGAWPDIDQQAANATPVQRLIDQEDVRQALATMDELPSRQREVLYLHACEALALTEIASVLGISTEAVKASLSLARKTMRRKLEHLCSDRCLEPRPPL